MAEPNVEGTYYVDGLLEGPLFGPGDRDAVEAFVRRAGEKGICLHATFDRARFSVLADAKPARGRAHASSVDVRLAACLDGLLENYSRDECRQLTSTLRSVEYAPGQEIQTLYGIRPDGRTNVEQRSVPVETVAPAAPMSRRQQIKIAGIAAAVLVVGVALSTLVVPYRRLGRRIMDRARPFDAEKLTVDVSAFEGLFAAEAVAVDSREGVLRLTFRVSGEYPATAEALDAAWRGSPSLQRKLALEALAKNNVRCVMFDREGRFVSQRLCYMHWDAEAKDVFAIAVAYHRYLGRLVIQY